MANVLLTVSGTIPADIRSQVESGARPRVDYLELARAMDADLMDYPEARRAAGPLAKPLERAGGPNMVLAYACFAQRKKYRVIMTDGEQVGLPLAILLRALGKSRPKHVMITHVLSVKKKMRMLDLLGAHHAIDRFLVYSSYQRDFIRNRWRLGQDRVILTPFMTDDTFFSPSRTKKANGEGALICSSGLERRDYPTFIEAVRGLDVKVTITAASLWAKQKDSTKGREIPPNVTVTRLTIEGLRQLYSDSRFLVMPLYPVDFQAGITAILEAMALGKAVICTRIAGQTDTVVDGETGIYVPPEDPAALRAAITRLLENPTEAERMGRAGNARLHAEGMTLDKYVERLARIVRETA